MGYYGQPTPENRAKPGRNPLEAGSAAFQPQAGYTPYEFSLDMTNRDPMKSPSMAGAAGPANPYADPYGAARQGAQQFRAVNNARMDATHAKFLADAKTPPPPMKPYRGPGAPTRAPLAVPQRAPLAPPAVLGAQDSAATQTSVRQINGPTPEPAPAVAGRTARFQGPPAPSRAPAALGSPVVPVNGPDPTVTRAPVRPSRRRAAAPPDPTAGMAPDEANLFHLYNKTYGPEMGHWAVADYKRDNAMADAKLQTERNQGSVTPSDQAFIQLLQSGIPFDQAYRGSRMVGNQPQSVNPGVGRPSPATPATAGPVSPLAPSLTPQAQSFPPYQSGEPMGYLQTYSPGIASVLRANPDPSHQALDAIAQQLQGLGMQGYDDPNSPVGQALLGALQASHGTVMGSLPEVNYPTSYASTVPGLNFLQGGGARPVAAANHRFASRSLLAKLQRTQPPKPPTDQPGWLERMGSLGGSTDYSQYLPSMPSIPASMIPDSLNSLLPYITGASTPSNGSSILDVLKSAAKLGYTPQGVSPFGG